MLFNFKLLFIFKFKIMEKKFLNLGKELSKEDQKSIQGGDNCDIASVGQYAWCMSVDGATMANCQQYAAAWAANCRNGGYGRN
jgi:hypothetical protein